jgi:hypothetical protein
MNFNPVGDLFFIFKQYPDKLADLGLQHWFFGLDEV